MFWMLALGALYVLWRCVACAVFGSKDARSHLLDYVLSHDSVPDPNTEFTRTARRYGYANTLAWILAAVIFVTPMFYEYPPAMSGKLASIEKGKLVFHPWGAFEDPFRLGWSDYIWVGNWTTTSRVWLPAVSEIGQVGELFFRAQHRINDIDLYYLSSFRGDKTAHDVAELLVHQFVQSRVLALEGSPIKNSAGWSEMLCAEYAEHAQSQMQDIGFKLVECEVEFEPA